MSEHINSLSGGHDIAAAFARLPAVAHQPLTPERAVQDQLSDQYGTKAQNYHAGGLAQHAEDFAAHHGGGHDDVIKQLTELVASLRAEIAAMKGGGAAAHAGRHSPLDSVTKNANEKAQHAKDNAMEDYDKYVAGKLEMKIMKKAADDILELWG